MNVIEDAYQRALKTYSKQRPPKRHLMDSSHVRNRHGSTLSKQFRVMWTPHDVPDLPELRKGRGGKGGQS
eukprot:scaffold7798_cov126-Isochrysis_galbana.AAC.3